jgi:hypothetical protein
MARKSDALQVSDAGFLYWNLESGEPGEERFEYLFAVL